MKRFDRIRRLLAQREVGDLALGPDDLAVVNQYDELTGRFHASVVSAWMRKLCRMTLPDITDDTERMLSRMRDGEPLHVAMSEVTDPVREAYLWGLIHGTQYGTPPVSFDEVQAECADLPDLYQTVGAALGRVAGRAGIRKSLR